MMSSPKLTNEEIKRYSRHLILPEIGIDGQKKLKASSVLLVGMGGLGAPLAMYLTASGVGRIGLVDYDVVDASNLQRQVIYSSQDVGKSKVQSAARKLHALNPHVRLDLYEKPLTSENALEIVENYDIVADGTDNFPTRYLVNDACVLLDKPNVYGSVNRFEGQVTVFYSKRGPCYRCLFPTPPDPKHVQSCAEAGVLGILPGLVGVLQATEVIKILLGIGEALVGRLIMYDALAMTFREIEIQKDANCPICGQNPSIKKLIDYDEFCGVAHKEENQFHLAVEAGGAAIKGGVFPNEQVYPAELKKALDKNENIIILDVRDSHECKICALENSLFIPMDEVVARLHEIDRNKTIVVVCKVGERSQVVVDLLKEEGYQKVHNLFGGLDLWAQEVEPDMPRY